MAKLVCQSGPRAGHEYPLRKDRTVFGRLQECDVVIPDAKSSREHFAIHRHGQLFALQDLGSRNGTKLNGSKIRERLLFFSDRIQVGLCEYQMVKEADDLELNELLSKYEIEELVGEGGMGIVFKARQRSMDRLVALKILSPRHAKRQELIDQFIEEARAVGSLSHPNLIQVHEVDTENQVHYFSMEFVDGPTCSGLLKSQQQLDPPIVLEIGRQTAKALAYAHSQRLIHRDIKPENLMLTSDNVIKVADLGISKTTEQLAEKNPDEVVGTPYYMAPEAGRGNSIDTRYDIYSLGATLFHLLTGSPPYTGRDGAAIIRAHINDPVPDIREYAPDTPASLADLITSMLAKDPRQRPQDAGELAQRFESLSLELGYTSQSGDDGTMLLRQLASAPVAADRRPRTDPDRAATNRTASKTVRRKQGVLPKVLVLLFFAVIGLIVYGVVSKANHAQAPSASPSGAPAPLFQIPIDDDAHDTDAAKQTAAQETERQSEWQRLLDDLDHQLNAAQDLDAVERALQQAQTLQAKGMEGKAAIRLQALHAQIEARLTHLREITAQQAFASLQDQVYLHMNAGRFAEAENLLADYFATHGQHAPETARNLQTDIKQRHQRAIASAREDIEFAIAAGDIPSLNALRSRIASTLDNAELLALIDRALKDIDDNRRQQRQSRLISMRKALQEWRLNDLESLIREHGPSLANSSEAAQMQELKAIGNDLLNLIASIDRGLRPRTRFEGTLQFINKPWLTGADRKGLHAEIPAGAVQIAWRDLSKEDWQRILQLATPNTVRDHQRLLEQREQVIRGGGQP